MCSVESNRNRVAAAILAGGAAGRYGGGAKGLIEVSPGLTIMERTIGEIRDSGVPDIVVMANDPTPYERFGCPIVPDLRPRLGPLGGIESALAYYENRFDGVLVVPCDLPAITSREIRALLEAFRRCDSNVVYARIQDSFGQPLCAVLHNDIRPEVTAALDEGKRKVGEVWHNIGAVSVTFADPAPFYNINFPEDLERWKADETGFPPSRE